MENRFHSMRAGAASNATSNSIGVLRYLLALVVVLHHTNGIMGLHIPLLLRPDTVVYAFFALSGFFAWQSFIRSSSVRTFVMHRLRRLLPTYWAVVGTSAIGLCAVSDLSTIDYFMSAAFWQYLIANGALLNFFAPELPGVFSDHLLTVVNGSLWYVKLEVLFTFVVPVSVHAIQRLGTSTISTCSSKSICFGAHYLGLWFVGGWFGLVAMFFSLRPMLWTESSLLSRYLCCFFMFLSGLIGAYCGQALSVRLHKCACIVFGFIGIASIVGVMEYIESPFLYFLCSAIVIWGLIVLFMLTRWGAFLNRNNMTYSLYLCHFPLIQLAYGLTSDIVVALGIAGLLLGVCTPLLYYGIERR